jgi:formate dehydrogenase subunit beta
METPSGAITPALVADPKLLDAANPLAPVMGLNGARVAGNVSAREPRGRIGVVLRSCELRALVELVKLQQANLDDLVTIGVDCLSTYDVPAYMALLNDGKVDLETLLAAAQSGDMAPQDGYSFRDGCEMCEKPHAEGADIVLELFGADLSAGVPVSLSDELGEKLGLGDPSPTPSPARRGEIVEKVVATRTSVRDERFAEIRQRIEQEGIEGVFAACVRCHNCMTVCPICYCKTCLFKSPVFDHEPIKYLDWARRKGAYRLPADTTIFHLTRLNHMVLSCIGCGMCTSACPAELPVGRVFRAIGSRVQETFEYEPGRSVEVPLPLVTFRDDVWTEVGEE